MSASPVQLQTKILRRSRAPEEYKIYRAALEWDLADPIVIESRQDFKSEPRWRDQMEPYHHQVTNLITFCRRLPVTLLADDVGLGKTISAGLVASELISRGRVSRILVVAPKLLGPQWQDELQSKFNIPAEIATGSKLIEAEPEDVGAVITTYHSARVHLDKIPEDRFDMLILDEAHKLRNLYGVDPPPKVAIKFREALEARRFRYVLMLTATPIHNRLWDLYSLIDLLTVARGHQNPFGSEGMFVRKFIADERSQARRLNPEARDEFRSIVYGYMSRVRRADAQLYFPSRVVQLHRVDPTPAELELIRVIAKPIQKLSVLAQISILQALTSSPHALQAQLNTMAGNGTVPQELAAAVRAIVADMPTSAKLVGLGALVEQLRSKQPDTWRMVVFTGRRETQTTIQAYLEERGITVGIINGNTGSRNQDTLARFRKDPPDIHVIVSTEAGSEGINLQVANVLTNYDLPWNPMVVEQRIGRVQRLASKHESVSIFNVILKDTFEEYIVGRLMQKLEMATDAIGDLESLLEATGVDDDDDTAAPSFEEKIRVLVLAALAGRDVAKATELELKSIDEAKRKLESEKKNINDMLGGMDGVEYVGPRAPKLPGVIRSMEPRDFVLDAFRTLGARVTAQADDLYLVEQNGGLEFIRFSETQPTAGRSTLYAPGSPAFSRLVDQIVATGVHQVRDGDSDPRGAVESAGRKWLATFGATEIAAQIAEVRRCFEGLALVRVRATVAHDSYERLVEVPCSLRDHNAVVPPSGLSPFTELVEDPATLGVKVAKLSEIAQDDPGIAEFCRFYLERRSQEIEAAKGDARKQKKLEDEFTPRLEMALTALEGSLYRTVGLKLRYSFDGSPEYESSVTVAPSAGDVFGAPEFGTCEITEKNVPKVCLGHCEMTGKNALRHLLVKSDFSDRYAMPDYTMKCSLSGKRMLLDEAAMSAVTEQPVANSLLRTSVLSGKRAEPVHIGRCEFTQAELLNSELLVSEVSGKRFRPDQEMKSVVSGKSGHRSEFITCHETREPLLQSEAERCEVTGQWVRPGVLEPCAVTGRRVLPSELERCAATGKKALKSLLVTSNRSNVRILEQVAVRSAHGNYCAPADARLCLWSGQKVHPDDLRTCELVGVSIHFEFATDEPTRLRPLVEVLQGTRRNEDAKESWDEISEKASTALRNRCRIEAAVLSPDRQHLAVSSEAKSFLGFKVNYAGLLYSLQDHAIVGRIAVGKRTASDWVKSEQ